jgi:hypothetical protein
MELDQGYRKLIKNKSTGKRRDYALYLKLKHQDT